jgi:hypothetical protein
MSVNEMDSDVVIPVIRDLRCDERIRQYTRDPSEGDKGSSNVYCDPKTSKPLRNQPPVERNERRFREVQSSVEEVTRHKYGLR